jgi:spore germination protein GerM
MSDRGRNGPEGPDDETARRLRDALGHEARAIQPSGDGLSQIRQRIQARRHSSRGWLRPLAVSAAALATAAVAVIVVVVVPRNSGDNSGQPSSVASSHSQAPSSSISTSPAQATGAPRNVTLFYVGTRADPQQLLYREIVTRPSPAGNAFLKDAVTAMLTTPAADADYTSYWPTGVTILGASIRGGTVAVLDLSAEVADAAPGAQGMGAISAQQLLYTIKAAAPKIETLELRIAGQPVTDLWGSPISQPIAAADAWTVFAHVWITSPVDHGTVSSVVKFGGEATVFEANVSWEILRNDGVVKQGHSMADIGAPGRGTWQATVTLAPGMYTIRAFEASAKDGSPTYVDDKIITVK